MITKQQPQTVQLRRHKAREIEAIRSRLHSRVYRQKKLEEERERAIQKQKREQALYEAERNRRLHLHHLQLTQIGRAQKDAAQFLYNQQIRESEKFAYRSQVHAQTQIRALIASHKLKRQEQEKEQMQRRMDRIRQSRAQYGKVKQKHKLPIHCTSSTNEQNSEQAYVQIRPASKIGQGGLLKNQTVQNWDYMIVKHANETKENVPVQVNCKKCHKPLSTNNQKRFPVTHVQSIPAKCDKNEPKYIAHRRATRALRAQHLRKFNDAIRAEKIAQLTSQELDEFL